MPPASGATHRGPQAGAPRRDAPKKTYRYIDRGYERTADFPIDPAEDISGVIASATGGPLRDYQDKLKTIQLREKGLSKAEIAEKVGRSEHWVKRWWDKHQAQIERPAGERDVVMQKASLSSFRDLDIRRNFLEDESIYEELVKNVQWRQAKVVGRDLNTGELGLRYDDRGRSINAGRQVADYTGGLPALDNILQKAVSTMDIRDPQARIFMNYYSDGQDRTGNHRHDFWTCLLSFGAPRILMVDNRPILMRDRDLVVFGMQSHGVPVMPEVEGGRISLVIFFYPDADNLERRQWSTITDGNEDGEEAQAATTDAIAMRSVDHGFKSSLLWGGDTSRSVPPAHSPHDCEGQCLAGDAGRAGAGAGETAVFATLAQALDPNAPHGALFSSPNSQLSFERPDSASAAPTAFGPAPMAFTMTCDDAAHDAVAAERCLFEQLKAQGVSALWDLRLRTQRGSWSEPEALRRRCAVREVKYRSYPLGRREAGGVSGHLRSDEGRDVLSRFAEAAVGEPSAILGAEPERRGSASLRAVAADWLTSGALGLRLRILHLSPGGDVEEHPPCDRAELETAAAPSEPPPPGGGGAPPQPQRAVAAVEERQATAGGSAAAHSNAVAGAAPAATSAASVVPSIVPGRAPSRWGGSSGGSGGGAGGSARAVKAPTSGAHVSGAEACHAAATGAASDAAAELPSSGGNSGRDSVMQVSTAFAGESQEEAPPAAATAPADSAPKRAGRWGRAARA